MQRTKRSLAALAMTVGALTAVSLTGCTSAGSSTSPNGSSSASKAVLTLGMNQDIPGWDPGVQPSYQGWAAMAVWDQLFRCDANGNAQPDVAQKWEFGSDQKTLTVQVRPGMKFSDGTAVDSSAVKASLEHGFASATSRLPGLTVETPNASTAVVKIKEANPLFKLFMCYQSITSAKAIKAGEASKTWTTPIGSGPYVLDTKATTSGSVYTFTKNKNYWDSATFPYQKLVLRVLSNSTAGINALKTGEVDGSLIPSTAVNEAKASSNLDLTTLKGPNTTRLLITDHLGKTIPALGKLKVRQAMNMVFDRDAMAKNLYQGNAVPAYQIFKPGSDAYIDGLQNPYPFDVAKAKQLMKEAGYADGFDLTIPTIAGNGNDLFAPYVKQQLAEININVTYKTLSGPNMYGDLLGGKYPVPLWQLGNYGQSLQDLADYVVQSGIWNVSHQPDATIAKYWADITAGKDVKANEQAMNKYVIDQAWFVPMVYADNFYAHAKSVSIPKTTDFAGLQPMLWDFK